MKMSCRRIHRTLLTKNKKIAAIAIGAAALLAMAQPALSDEAPKKDEVFAVTAAIKVPHNALTTFDISWFNPVVKKYYLADRDNKAIDIFDVATNSITQTTQVFGGIAGSGPNGVWTVNDKEVWAGDGDSTVKVFGIDGSSRGLLSTVGISTNGKGRIDEGCFDPRDQLVEVHNNREPGGASSFISFIATAGPNAHTVVGKLNISAGLSIEQCQWDPQTGKFYVNIADANTVLRIVPKTMKIDATFNIPCTGPAGLTIGAHNQILLGCNGLNTNSVIINAQSGVVEQTLTGLGGTDEVWFNRGDGHYFIPVCGGSCRAAPFTDQLLAVIDSEGFLQDNSVHIAPGSSFRIKSVAVDPSGNTVFLPVPKGDGTACSSAAKINSIGGTPDDTTGCILELTTKHHDDRRLVRHEREQE
jgi:DNA-binding beta-propeller fold protein YncE